jgi:hypothetical protein
VSQLTQGHTRRELIRTGAAGIAGAAGATLVAPSVVQAQTVRGAPTTVTQRLARLVGLERLAVYTYEHVLESPILSPGERLAVTPLLAHERAHVAALERLLAARGGRAPAPPASLAAANRDFSHRRIGGRLGHLRGRPDALQLLRTIEEVTVGAYFVALLKLDEPELIAAITEIMAVDAQHHAILGLQLPPFSLQAAAPYGLIQGTQ